MFHGLWINGFGNNKLVEWIRIDQNNLHIYDDLFEMSVYTFFRTADFSTTRNNFLRWFSGHYMVIRVSFFDLDLHAMFFSSHCIVSYSSCHLELYPCIYLKANMVRKWSGYENLYGQSKYTWCYLKIIIEVHWRCIGFNYLVLPMELIVIEKHNILLMLRNLLVVVI